MTTPTAIAPANQARRINTLRVTVLCLLPAIFFSTPALPVPELLAEIVENFGILLVIFGVLGRFWSILYIGSRKNAEVLQDGPYSMCRHPLYLFSTLGVVGFGLMLGSVVVAVALTGLVFLILSRVAAKEEAFLRAKFGPAYDRYAQNTPRILPAWRQFTTAQNVTFDVGPLRRNFFDALVFLSLIPLGELLEYFKAQPYWWTFPIY